MPEETTGDSAGYRYVVCLGASAGGLEALGDFLAALPPNPGVPFVVVVHLSPDFKSLMPELLSKHTAMQIRAAIDGVVLEADNVYIIPPGKNMAYSNGKLRLREQDRAPGHSLNLPINLFLESVAEASAVHTIAVILSGTGSDGTRGIRSVKEQGGVVFAQTPTTAKFDGMPLSAIQTGLVDHQGDSAALAKRVAELVKGPLPSLDDAVDLEGSDGEHVDQILALLREGRKLDVSYFRRKMLVRRIRRRMAILRETEIGNYCTRLTQDHVELAHLHEDLLIGVTGFFRDPDAYKVLERDILPDLLLAVPAGETMRVWISACSNGHEAYSIAMMILEGMQTSGIIRDLKIFATDVSEPALERAARGTYSLSEAADVAVPLLSKYFELKGSSYTVRPELRQCIIFARHNVVTDPPFTRTHLVTCRNLLIYLETEAQEQVLGTLYGALKPDVGVLFLGAAETPGSFDGKGLECLDSKQKLYRRVGAPPHGLPVRRALREPLSVVQSPVRTMGTGGYSRVQGEAKLLRAVLETTFETERQSAAVIDHDSRLVDVLTDPLELFRLPKGKPTTDLAMIFGSGLVAAISSAQQRLKAGETSASYSAVPGDGDGAEVGATLYSLPSSGSQPHAKHSGLVLLVLREHSARAERPAVKSVHVGSVERVSSLEAELRHTKENLQATIEELQSSNEEQQSTNEELVASNEELQSTNEELHSVNEELYTVNSEYHNKNKELQTLSADLDNLLNSMNVATLYLDSGLRIRRFTPLIGRVLPLQATDIGRSIVDIAHQLDTDFVEDVKNVRTSGEPAEKELRDRQGAWVLMRLSAYRSVGGSDNGVLGTFVDVTRVKNAMETARVMSEQLATTTNTLTERSEQIDDMFSMVAHDLKRPVVGLDGVLKLADEALTSGDETAVRKYFQSALEATRGLRRMLKDLGSVALVSREDVELETVDVGPWLDKVMHPFSGRAEAAGVRLAWVCDHGELEFARAAGEGALTNLVENALVHGASGEEPRVDVACQVDKGLLRITVADNGPGIAAEHHARVFELFRRLSPEDSEGSGVGLVAVERFVEKAQGTLRLESAKGQGAKFIVELPVEERWPDRTSSVRESILLVDDDHLDAKRVRAVLAGYNVRWVRTLVEAKDEVRVARFGLILLDLSLPDGHGLQLTTALGTMNKNTPVLILSGQTEGLMKGALEAAHVFGAIDKDSVEDPKFRELVQSALASDTRHA